MQSKIFILCALISLAVGASLNKESEKATGDTVKEKRGLFEFGYGYGIDTGSDPGYYIYPVYPTSYASVTKDDLSLPSVQHARASVPVQQYVQIPSYATTVNQYPAPLKLAQPYTTVSYVKHTPSNKGLPIYYEQKINKYSTW